MQLLCLFIEPAIELPRMTAEMVTAPPMMARIRAYSAAAEPVSLAISRFSFFISRPLRASALGLRPVRHFVKKTDGARKSGRIFSADTRIARRQASRADEDQVRQRKLN